MSQNKTDKESTPISKWNEKMLYQYKKILEELRAEYGNNLKISEQMKEKFLQELERNGYQIYQLLHSFLNEFPVPKNWQREVNSK